MALSQVDFFDLRFDRNNSSPVLFLKDAQTDKFLPVWIGEQEANSIELAVTQREAARPLTHDLFTNVMRSLDVRVTKVVIDRLESTTYFATLHLEQAERQLAIDCRPSDAIAIALRENVEIFVDEDLMFSIKFVELSDGEEGGEGEARVQPMMVEPEANEANFQEFLKRISPADFKEN